MTGSRFCLCGAQTIVIKSSLDADGNVVRRRRCPDCRRTSSTLETVTYRDPARKEKE